MRYNVASGQPARPGDLSGHPTGGRRADEPLTRAQTARTSRPDATDGGSEIYLLKRVSLLRLTNQITRLTEQARRSGGRLTIRVPRTAATSPDLRGFLAAHREYVRLRRVD